MWDLGRSRDSLSPRDPTSREGGGRLAAPKRTSKPERKLNPVLEALRDTESSEAQDQWWTQCLYDIQDGMDEKYRGNMIVTKGGSSGGSRGGGRARGFDPFRVELGNLANLVPGGSAGVDMLSDRHEFCNQLHRTLDRFRGSDFSRR